jgi:ribosome biogenesis GTPase
MIRIKEDAAAIAGVILKSVGGVYSVETADGIFSCKARGIFRKDGVSPYVGDRVGIVELEQPSHAADGGDAVIVEIKPRANEIVRPPVANIDYIVFVVSAIDPAPNFEVLDKFIAVALYKNIKTLIAVTKTDLTDGAVSAHIDDIYDRNVADVFIMDYNDSSETSAVNKLVQTITGKKSVFTGNTGVGKSTLLNRIDPSIAAKVGETSRKLGRGKHTTRTVEFYKLGSGTYIADTPGFGVFDTGRYDYIYKDELAYCFRDFRPYLTGCRFQGCSHTKEMGCNVIKAVQEGDIPQSRFNSYLKMYQEAAALKPWEQGG